MSLKTTIEHLSFERIYEDLYPKDVTVVKTTFNGKTYVGDSYCCENDKMFLSNKVGMNIACMRAMIRIFKAEEERAKESWYALKNMYNNLFRMEEEFDPTGLVAYSVNQAEGLYRKYRIYRLDKERELRHYLEAHNKMIESITNYRNCGQK